MCVQAKKKKSSIALQSELVMSFRVYSEIKKLQEIFEGFIHSIKYGTLDLIKMPSLLHYQPT